MTEVGARHLFVHVEEPSMKEAVEALLPPLLAGRSVECKIIDHGSKHALLTNLPRRLRGYADWPEPGLRIMVLVDRDDDDCMDLKRRLESAAQAARLPTKTSPDFAGRFKVVNRIVVEELEAWFLGDVPALMAAFPGIPPTLEGRAKFRNPDAVTGGTWEALLKVLKQAGHYTQSAHLPKIEVARRVATQMVAARNRSKSFQAFVTGLNALLTT